jgi:hypothetical protein
VASLGLLGLGGLYYFFGGDPESAHNIHGFGMGASSVASIPRAPTSAQTSWARWKRASQKMIPATPG